MSHSFILHKQGPYPAKHPPLPEPGQLFGMGKKWLIRYNQVKFSPPREVPKRLKVMEQEAGQNQSCSSPSFLQAASVFSCNPQGFSPGTPPHHPATSHIPHPPQWRSAALSTTSLPAPCHFSCQGQFAALWRRDVAPFTPSKKGQVSGAEGARVLRGHCGRVLSPSLPQEPHQLSLH